MDKANFSVSWKKFAVSPISPVNILSYFGLIYQPDLYSLVLPTDSVGYVPVAFNRHPNMPNVKYYGCCRQFGIRCNSIVDFIYFNNGNLDLIWKSNPIWFHNSKSLLSKHEKNVDVYLTKNLYFKTMSKHSCGA